MSTAILAAQAVDYTYPGGVQALKQADIVIPRGSKLALLGANGCGKTTLLLHLNATLKPQGGHILLDGQPLAYDARTRSAWRSRVGLVLQEPDDQLFSAQVYQDVSFGPLNMGLSEIETRRRIDAALRALDIIELADRPTHRLSFGQKKRVAIAGILTMQPEVMILDEPTAGLDPCGVAQLLDALQRLHDQGATLVLSTHDVDLAYSWADQVAVFAEGRVRRQGTSVEVLADRELLSACGLRMPALLEIALALRGEDNAEASGCWQPPRSQEALLQLLRQQLDPTRLQTLF